MARFVFSLEAVLQQRENQEHLAQRELAAAQLEQQKLEQQLSSVEQEINATNQAMRSDHLIGKLNTSLLGAHRRYLAAQKVAVFRLAEEIAAARLVVEAKRRLLAEASKDRKAIELLREKQQSRWQAEQQRKELAAADDVAMQMAFAELQRSEPIGTR